MYESAAKNLSKRWPPVILRVTERGHCGDVGADHDQKRVAGCAVQLCFERCALQVHLLWHHWAGHGVTVVNAMEDLKAAARCQSSNPWRTAMACTPMVRCPGADAELVSRCSPLRSWPQRNPGALDEFRQIQQFLASQQALIGADAVNQQALVWQNRFGALNMTAVCGQTVCRLDQNRALDQCPANPNWACSLWHRLPRKRRRRHGRPSAPPEPAQCRKCHACRTKAMPMSPSATPATQKATCDQGRHQRKRHACHAKATPMSPRATLATQRWRRCHQVLGAFARNCAKIAAMGFSDCCCFWYLSFSF